MRSQPSGKLLADRVLKAGPGEAVDVWIYSSFPKDNWVARRPGDLTHAEHPGTAIEIGDDLFEILAAEETTGPGYVVRYGLKKWDPKHTVRVKIPYTPATQAQLVADYLDEEEKRKLRARILWLFPLAGLAPDPMLREWEQKTALNMRLISAGSAALTLFLCLSLVEILGGFSSGRTVVYFIGYLGIESFFRLLRIGLSGKPRGSPVLTIPYVFWEALARPEKRRKRQEDRVKFTFGQDEVIRQPGKKSLLIRSMLFDDVLVGPAPIVFEGTVYRPLGWHDEGKGLEYRVVYEFEKIDAIPGTRYREYTQPRTPERQKVVEALTHHRGRVQIFAVLWGTFPRGQQLRLEAKYGFTAARWTANSAGLLLAGALLQICLALSAHASWLLIVVPVFVVFESLYRLYHSKVRGLPAGSVVGYAFRLFLKPPR